MDFSQNLPGVNGVAIVFLGDVNDLIHGKIRSDRGEFLPDADGLLGDLSVEGHGILLRVDSEGIDT